MEGHKFNKEQVWTQAWRRLKAKADAIEEKAQQAIRRADSRGEAPPSMAERTNPLDPIAIWNDEGKLVWDDAICQEIERLKGNP